MTLGPAGSDVSSTVTGSTSPSTPSVTVSRTCYQVDLYGTIVLECRDSKGTSALQSARWLRSPDYSQVTTSTGDNIYYYTSFESLMKIFSLSKGIICLSSMHVIYMQLLSHVQGCVMPTSFSVMF